MHFLAGAPIQSATDVGLHYRAHLDDLAIEKIVTSISSKSDYRAAVAKARKARDKKYQLFLEGKIDECDTDVHFAMDAGQYHPLTFSDFCALIDLDVSQKAIAKMQEAIKIFAKFDEDGSGAIDGDEVHEASSAQRSFGCVLRHAATFLTQASWMSSRRPQRWKPSRESRWMRSQCGRQCGWETARSTSRLS